MPSRRVVERFLTAYNDHDVGEMLTMVHPDVRWVSVSGDSSTIEAEGAAELESSLRSYFASLPSARAAVLSIMAAGRFVAVSEHVRWEADGFARSQTALAIYEVTSDRIRRVWYYPAQR